MGRDRVAPPAPSAVRVAVLNQPVSTAASRTQARRARLRTAGLVPGIAEGLPGLDLLVLPEFGTHGTAVLPSGRAFTDPGEDLAYLSDACRRAGTWLVAPLGGGGVRRAAAHHCALFDRTGRVVARYATGPGGTHGGRVVEGPGGLRTAVTFADTVGSAVADPALRGAELIIVLRCGPSPGPGPEPVQTPVRALAWTHTCYVVAANAWGARGSDRWSGWSLIAGFDGEVLAECVDLECELAVADLEPDTLRRTRADRVRRAAGVRDVLRRSRVRTPARPCAPTC